MDAPGTPDAGAEHELPENNAYWYDYLTRGDPRERAYRKFLVRLPSGPRCYACAAPFSSVGGRVMRAIGKGPSDRNPHLCDGCFSYMRHHPGGAEIPCTMLFADVRGSTTMAEQVSATQFTALMSRFYKVATAQVFAHDGGVDKFVGDEVVAMFYPLAAGEEHARKAIDTALGLLKETGHGRPEGPWIPVGAGVHSGMAWVGAIGDASYVEFTTLGDAVNTAARLASVAAAGEILVTVDTARAAGLEGIDRLPHSSLSLKGKQVPVEVVRLGVEALAA